jgi:hypothetical protein
VRRLGELGLDTVLVIDEPGLAMASRLTDPDARTGGCRSVWDPLRAVAGAWGLHVCGEVPWRLLDELEPDVISAG